MGYTKEEIYAYNIHTVLSNPVASQTDYWMTQNTPGTTLSYRDVKIPVAGVIRKVYIKGIAAGAQPGTAENWSLYIRLNNTTDTLIETVGVSNVLREWENNNLSISVTEGDSIVIKDVKPNWVTPPTNNLYYGVIVISH